MPRFLEWAQKIFGSETPEHTFVASLKSNTISVNVEIKQPRGTMVVRYEPGTEIRFADEKDYRPFGDDEVIFAK